MSRLWIVAALLIVLVVIIALRNRKP